MVKVQRMSGSRVSRFKLDMYNNAPTLEAQGPLWKQEYKVCNN